MSLKSVFFDFGGTIDTYPEIYNNALEAMEKIIRLLRDNGVGLPDQISPESFLRHLDRASKRYKAWRKTTLIEVSTVEFWNKYILPDISAGRIVDPKLSEELTYLIETGRYTRSVRPEMISVMEELTTSTSLNFGIISNIISKTQVPRCLEDYRLEKYFSQVILSAEFGKVKPDVSIFHHAADLYECRPDECVYVGNSPSKDVEGAKNAGYMAAVQIEYTDDAEDAAASGCSPDYYIKSMNELPAIIDTLLQSEAREK